MEECDAGPAPPARVGSGAALPRPRGACRRPRPARWQSPAPASGGPRAPQGPPCQGGPWGAGSSARSTRVRTGPTPGTFCSRGSGVSVWASWPVARALARSAGKIPHWVRVSHHHGMAHRWPPSQSARAPPAGHTAQSAPRCHGTPVTPYPHWRWPHPSAAAPHQFPQETQARTGDCAPLSWAQALLGTCLAGGPRGADFGSWQLYRLREDAGVTRPRGSPALGRSH